MQEAESIGLLKKKRIRTANSPNSALTASTSTKNSKNQYEQHTAATNTRSGKNSAETCSKNSTHSANFPPNTARRTGKMVQDLFVGPTGWSNHRSGLNSLKKFKVTSFSPNLMRFGCRSTKLDGLDENYLTNLYKNRQRKKWLNPTSKGDEKILKNP